MHLKSGVSSWCNDPVSKLDSAIDKSKCSLKLKYQDDMTTIPGQRASVVGSLLINDILIAYTADKDKKKAKHKAYSEAVTFLTSQPVSVVIKGVPPKIRPSQTIVEDNPDDVIMVDNPGPSQELVMIDLTEDTAGVESKNLDKDPTQATSKTSPNVKFPGASVNQPEDTGKTKKEERKPPSRRILSQQRRLFIEEYRKEKESLQRGVALLVKARHDEDQTFDLDEEFKTHSLVKNYVFFQVAGQKDSVQCIVCYENLVLGRGVGSTKKAALEHATANATATLKVQSANQLFKHGKRLRQGDVQKETFLDIWFHGEDSLVTVGQPQESVLHTMSGSSPKSAPSPKSVPPPNKVSPKSLAPENSGDKETSLLLSEYQSYKTKKARQMLVNNLVHHTNKGQLVENITSLLKFARTSGSIKKIDKGLELTREIRCHHLNPYYFFRKEEVLQSSEQDSLYQCSLYFENILINTGEGVSVEAALINANTNALEEVLCSLTSVDEICKEFKKLDPSDIKVSSLYAVVGYMKFVDKKQSPCSIHERGSGSKKVNVKKGTEVSKTEEAKNKVSKAQEAKKDEAKTEEVETADGVLFEQFNLHAKDGSPGKGAIQYMDCKVRPKVQTKTRLRLLLQMAQSSAVFQETYAAHKLVKAIKNHQLTPNYIFRRKSVSSNISQIECTMYIENIHITKGTGKNSFQALISAHNAALDVMETSSADAMATEFPKLQQADLRDTTIVDVWKQGVPTGKLSLEELAHQMEVDGEEGKDSEDQEPEDVVQEDASVASLQYSIAPGEIKLDNRPNELTKSLLAKMIRFTHTSRSFRKTFEGVKLCQAFREHQLLPHYLFKNNEEMTAVLCDLYVDNLLLSQAEGPNLQVALAAANEQAAIKLTVMPQNVALKSFKKLGQDDIEHPDVLEIWENGKSPNGDSNMEQLSNVYLFPTDGNKDASEIVILEEQRWASTDRKLANAIDILETSATRNGMLLQWAYDGDKPMKCTLMLQREVISEASLTLTSGALEVCSNWKRSIIKLRGLAKGKVAPDQCQTLVKNLAAALVLFRMYETQTTINTDETIKSGTATEWLFSSQKMKKEGLNTKAAHGDTSKDVITYVSRKGTSVSSKSNRSVINKWVQLALDEVVEKYALTDTLHDLVFQPGFSHGELVHVQNLADTYGMSFTLNKNSKSQFGCAVSKGRDLTQVVDVLKKVGGKSGRYCVVSKKQLPNYTYVRDALSKGWE